MASMKKLLLFTLVAAVAGASDAGAQDTTRVASADPAPAATAGDSSTKAGPRISPSGITRSVEVTGVAAAAQRRQSMGRPMSLMIVGGAAVILGVVIGGDIGVLMEIGGAVAFLIGLYEYVK